MKDTCKRLRLIHSNDGEDVDRNPTLRLPVIAAVIVLAALVAAGLQWQYGDAGPVRETAAQPHAESVGFDYFPGQYVNQAKEAEEHIPAF